MNIINRNLVVVFHLLLSSSPCIFRCLLQRAKLLLVWVMGMLSNHPTAISPASLRGGGESPPPPETVAAAVIVVGGDMSEPREGEGGRGRKMDQDKNRNHVCCRLCCCHCSQLWQQQKQLVSALSAAGIVTLPYCRSTHCTYGF